jgi:hypothetical protein
MSAADANSGTTSSIATVTASNTFLVPLKHFFTNMLVSFSLRFTNTITPTG